MAPKWHYVNASVSVEISWRKAVKRKGFSFLHMLSAHQRSDILAAYSALNVHHTATARSVLQGLDQAIHNVEYAQLQYFRSLCIVGVACESHVASPLSTQMDGDADDSRFVRICTCIS